jgi:hypothetical protein
MAAYSSTSTISKRVNDSLSHLVGDTLLRIVAARITACLRATDVVARFGNDEVHSGAAARRPPAATIDSTLAGWKPRRCLPEAAGVHRVATEVAEGQPLSGHAVGSALRCTRPTAAARPKS